MFLSVGRLLSLRRELLLHRIQHRVRTQRLLRHQTTSLEAKVLHDGIGQYLGIGRREEYLCLNLFVDGGVAQAHAACGWV